MSRDEPFELNPAERELESALRSLRPAPASGVDAIAAAVAAGAASRRPSIYAWRAAAAVLVVALGAAVTLPSRSATSPPAVVAEAPAVRLLATEPRGAGAYVRLRQRVLDQGLDALPIPAHASDGKAKRILRAGDITGSPL